jgi:hypothetical protein
VSPKAVLDVVVKIEIPGFSREWNPSTPIVERGKLQRRESHCAISPSSYGEMAEIFFFFLSLQSDSF